jgi:hypothetical protein
MFGGKVKNGELVIFEQVAGFALPRRCADTWTAQATMVPLDDM